MSLNSDYGEHYPVFYREVFQLVRDLLESRDGPLQIADFTFGAGGHSLGMAKLDPRVKVLSFDQDPEAFKNAQEIISTNGLDSQIEIVNRNFSEFKSVASEKELSSFDLILADLGVSSHHFDSPERGFSFRFEGPLDMRMNPNQGESAADLVNTWDLDDLENIFRDYGEERWSRRIAERIGETRSEKAISTTKDLEDIIFHCYPKKARFGKTHPATRVFQALRIAVNRELDVLDQVLREAPSLLSEKGMFAIISFHSLEDRKVKIAFKDLSRNHQFKLKSKKPLVPTDEELKENSRSRSAKLRVLIQGKDDDRKKYAQ